MLNPALALHYLDAGLPLAEKLGSAWWMGSIRIYQALAYLLEDKGQQAEAALKAVRPRDQAPRTLLERRIAWAWGELVLAQGEPQSALQIAERLLASAPGEMPTQPIPRLWKLPHCFLPGYVFSTMKSEDFLITLLFTIEWG